MDNRSDGDGFILTASLTANDLRLYEKQNRTSQQWLVRWLALIGWMACTALAMGVAAGISNETIVGLGAGLTVNLGLAAAFKRREDAWFRRRSEEHISYVLLLNRSGIIQKVGRTETRYQWSEVERVGKTADFLEITAWDGVRFVLPQHTFSDLHQFDLAYEFASEQQRAVVVGHA